MKGNEIQEIQHIPFTDWYNKALHLGFRVSCRTILSDIHSFTHSPTVTGTKGQRNRKKERVCVLSCPTKIKVKFRFLHFVSCFPSSSFFLLLIQSIKVIMFYLFIIYRIQYSRGWLVVVTIFYCVDSTESTLFVHLSLHFESTPFPSHINQSDAMDYETASIRTNP